MLMKQLIDGGKKQLKQLAKGGTEIQKQSNRMLSFEGKINLIKKQSRLDFMKDIGEKILKEPDKGTTNLY